jgi:GcrA cell cycle regulator
MSWTDERVETLKRRWNDGASASTIASELGNTSRNAVIGKIHRLKLPGRPQTAKPKPAATQERRRPMSKGSRVSVKIQARQSDMGRTEIALPTFVELPFRMPETSFFGTDALVALSEKTCKWPVGDPRDGDFRFCNADKCNDNAYCLHHQRMAYSPKENRERVRRAA